MANGMRWRFPRETEVEVLKDWALLMRHTSNTLEELTLENRYLVGGGYDVDRSLEIAGETDNRSRHDAPCGVRMLFYPAMPKIALPGVERSRVASAEESDSGRHGSIRFNDSRPCAGAR